MIYLGEQIEALEYYSKEAICWFGIKIKGRLTLKKPEGYRCNDRNCKFCTSKMKMRSRIDQDFRNLFTNERIEKLITGKPDEIDNLNSVLLTEFKGFGHTEAQFKGNADKYVQDEHWNYKLAKLIDKHTCTYCNREYTFTIPNPEKGRGLVPQFDHWFSKSDKPILGLSFYNLIPSCATCNGIKSSIEMTLQDHLHPYMDSNISSSYSFNFLLEKAHQPSVNFRYDNILNSKGQKTVEALNLPLIYKGHSSKELQDLYNLRFKYSDNYLEILLNKTFSSHLPISDQEKYRLIFGIEMEEEHYHKRIMSKFKKDIIDKLLSIK